MLGGNCFRAVPAHVAKFPALERLSFAANNLTTKSVCSEIGSLTSLRELYLHGNALRREPVGVRRLNRVGQLRECQLGLFDGLGAKLKSRFIDERAEGADARDPRRILRNAFDRYDVDGSGSIDAGEFGALCAHLGVALGPEEAAGALQAMDLDGNGTVEYEEFCYFFESF